MSYKGQSNAVAAVVAVCNMITTVSLMYLLYRYFGGPRIFK